MINTNPFNDLVNKRIELHEAELTDEQCNKLKGDCYPGCKVRIYWDKSITGAVFYDEGYVFVGEDMDYADEGDCFVHVPNPDNPGGIGPAEPEFKYMIELLLNPLVIKVQCK